MGCKNSKQTNVAALPAPPRPPPNRTAEEVEVTLQDYYQQRELLLPEFERSECNKCCVCSRRVGVADYPEGVARQPSNPKVKASVRGMRKSAQYSKLKNENNNVDVTMPKNDGIEVVKSFDLEFGLEEYKSSPFQRKRSVYEDVFCATRSNNMGDVATDGVSSAETDSNFTPRRKNSWPRDGRHYVEKKMRKRLRHDDATQQLRPRKRCRKFQVDLPPRHERGPPPAYLGPSGPFASMEVFVKTHFKSPFDRSVTSVTSVTGQSLWSDGVSSIAMEEGGQNDNEEDPENPAESSSDDTLNDSNNSLDNEGKRPLHETTDSETDSDGVPLREDPAYEKYFRMLKMGLPEGAVRHALQKDRKDPGILDLDPTKSLKSQRNSGSENVDGGPPLKEDPEYTKYFKMLKIGLPEGAVRHALQKDGKDPGILDLDPEKSLKSQQSRESDQTEDDCPPLNKDPEYAKYFKMLQVGLPEGAVRNALQRDGKDPGILDFDPEKSLKSLQKEGFDIEDDDEPPLNKDPEYEKYFKMLKMGLPADAVRHALQRDGKDPGILDLDPEKSLKSQQENNNSDDDPPLNKDPEYTKYFKMLKMGLPEGAVRNALQRDGKDTGIMDLDPEKSLKSQTTTDDSKEDTEDGPPLKEDPEYVKYFKMLKMGLPEGAVRQALQRDGKDPGIMDLDPEQSLKSQTKAEPSAGVDEGPPLKEDPEYSKYFKMLKTGLPEGAVRQALQRDGKDPGIALLDPEKSLQSQMNGSSNSNGKSENENNGPPLKDDPEYSKYFKMQKIGLPEGAVKQALQRDGKDSAVLDLDPDRSLASQTKTEGGDSGVPLKDDPEYSKYFKMLKMGLPVGAVKNALQRDDKDPGIMDLNPEKSVAAQRNGGTADSKKEQKKRVRRKKIFWTPIDPDKIQEGSIWSMCRGSFVMDSLKYDSEEFEMLFTESSNPDDKKKKGTLGAGKSEKRKSIQLIEGKRGMNGGIILARLKIEYSKLATMVDTMESGNLDSTQLRALREYLPTDEERKALNDYVNENGGAVKVELKGLSECEKYMIEMLKVTIPDAKFDCMLFRKQFDHRLDDVNSAIDTVGKACEQVRSSDKLRNIMGMILTVVNHINTGGNGNLAAGFSLDALLKLNEAKAFDRKTSVLEYLVKLVKQNNETLLLFKDDIDLVSQASDIQLGTLESDFKAIRGELTEVQKTASEEADRLEKGLSDLEKKSSVGLTEKIATGKEGRTPMEKFVLQAAASMEETDSSIDELKRKYLTLLQYFGEDETMPSNEFFGTIHRFILAFGSTVDEVRRKEKAKLKEKLRAAAKKVGAAKKMATKHWKTKSKSPKEESDANQTTSPGPEVSSGEAGHLSLGLAAPAAAKARNCDSRGEDDDQGKIAAAAAVEAALRARKNRPSVDDTARASVAIAAAAAAAARKSGSGESDIAGESSHAAQERKVQSATDGEHRSSASIAGVAADAARNRNSSGDNDAPTPSGTLEQNQHDETDQESCSSVQAVIGNGTADAPQNRDGSVSDSVKIVGTGIAAAAAAAAALRSKSKLCGTDEEGLASREVDDDAAGRTARTCDVPATPGASALGKNGCQSKVLNVSGDASATQERNAKNSSAAAVTAEPARPRDSFAAERPALGGGGIAAAAAAAAALRTKKKLSSMVGKPSSGSTTEDQARDSRTAENLTKKYDYVSVNKVQETEKELVRSVQVGRPSIGIAEAAAAAAAARNRESCSGIVPDFSGSGIAAAAAAAGAFRSQKVQHDTGRSAIETISASAAAEARDLAALVRLDEAIEAATAARECPAQCQDTSKDAAIAASEARRGDAAAVAEAAAAYPAEHCHESSKDVAAATAAARQGEAASLAHEALLGSGSAEESLKIDKARSAAAARQNEAMSAIAVALAASRKQGRREQD